MNYLTKQLTINGIQLKLEGKPFPLRGISFFNALFNESFCESDQTMRYWLKRFHAKGINMLRVWCHWNFPNSVLHFADQAEGACLFTYRGDLKEKYARRLIRLFEISDELGMVIETVALSQESYALQPPKKDKYPPELIPVQEKEIEQLTRLCLPYRNHIFQIWNEAQFEVPRYFSIVKSLDPEKIVTNSREDGHIEGEKREYQLLDVLTPHTYRSGNRGPFYQVAPQQIKTLIETYQKPVIDDEPARGGMLENGGIKGGTQPWQHVEHMRAIERVGGYPVYHHDMFQNGYGHPCTPQNGIPDPEFGAHHDVWDAFQSN